MKLFVAKHCQASKTAIRASGCVRDVLHIRALIPSSGEHVDLLCKQIFFNIEIETEFLSEDGERYT